MATFVLNLVRDEDPKPFRAICSILGEVSGFSGSVRRFENESDIMKALTAAGIQAERYTSAVRLVVCGEQGSLTLDQNEAQILGVLQTDSSE